MAFRPLPLDQDGMILDEVRCSPCDYNLQGLSPAGVCPECGAPVAESLVARAVCMLDAEGRIDEPIQCRICKHDARGLKPEDACPDCGSPLGDTLESGLFRYAPKPWLNRLTAGFTLYIITTFVGISLFILIAVLTSLFPQDRAIVATAQLGVVSVIGLLSILAVFFITSSHSDLFSRTQGGGARQWARIFVVFMVGIQIPSTVVLIFNQTAGQLLNIIPSLLAVGLFISLYTHAGSLARRMPDERLAKSTRVVVWGYTISSVVAILGTAVMFALAWNYMMQIMQLTPGTQPPPPAGQDMVGMIGGGCITGIGSLGSIVFTIWAIVLLFMYRNRFARAARMVR